MSNVSIYQDASSFENAQRVAKSLSASKLVPATYQNNIADCLIALETANRLGMSPMMIMQNLHIIHGRPSWSATFLISAVNQSGRFSPLRYELTNDRCRAYATDLATGEIVYGPEVTIEMAKQEGWYNKAGSKWKTMPQLMLSYRAAAFFARLYAPDLTMGYKTVEENQDIGIQTIQNHRPRTTATDINSRIFDAEAEVVQETPQDAVQEVPAVENEPESPESPEADDPFGFLTED